MTADRQYPFTRILVVANPSSKNATAADTLIAALRKAYPRQVRRLEIDPELAVTRRNVLDTLAQTLRQGDTPVIAIAGGDGTVNLVLQTLVGPGVPVELQQVPIIPLGTGNANDLAHMLYADPTAILDNFRQGVPVDIRPIVCMVTAPKGIAERHVASNYVSFGATAIAAHELNRPDVRHQSRLNKWYGSFMPDFLAIRAAVQAPTFSIVKDGKELKIRDILVGNGERIAKFGKMPSKLAKPELYITMVRDNWLGKSAVPLGAIRLILGRVDGELIRGQSFEFTVSEQVAMQFDGEPFFALSGSTIHIEHAATSFRALTTKQD